MTTNFEGLQQPVLPHAAKAYDPAFHSQYSNALRLFFNRLVTRINAFGDSGGAGLVGFDASESYAAGTVGAALATVTETNTVAALTAAATAGAGARSFVTDATATTFASIVAGGGANGAPVFCDGTNWRIG